MLAVFLIAIHDANALVVLCDGAAISASMH